MTWMSEGESGAVHRLLRQCQGESGEGRQGARSRAEPSGGDLGPEIREDQIGHLPGPCLREVRAVKDLAIGQGDCSEGVGYYAGNPVGDTHFSP